jgi:hypothetical protein
MEFIKNNWFVVLIILCIFAYLSFKSDPIPEYQKEITKKQKENIVLKSNIKKREKETKILKVVVQKIRAEKESSTKRYHFDLENKEKIIKDLSSELRKSKKDVLRYKELIIKKDAPKSILWDFSLNIRNDFEEYIKKTLLENRKTDLLIKKKDESLKDCLKLNLNSEKIIFFKEKTIILQKKKIKKLKKQKVLIIIGSILTFIGFKIAFN